MLTANSKAEPAATSNLWQIFIHVNSTKGIQSSRTDSGLVLVYNLESEGAVFTEHIRKELTENSPEALRHRTCVHQQRCRLVLGVSSKNSVGRSDTVMVDVFEFGFMISCENFNPGIRSKFKLFGTNIGIYYKTNF